MTLEKSTSQNRKYDFDVAPIVIFRMTYSRMASEVADFYYEKAKILENFFSNSIDRIVFPR